MNRIEFLKTAGFKGAALFALLTSCTKDKDSYIEALTVDGNGKSIINSNSTNASTNTGTGSSTTGTTTTNNSGTITTTELNAIKNYLAKIELSAGTSSALKTVGGYITINNAIVLAQSTAGVYVAATKTCTHEPKKKIIFNKTEFYCTDHGARFSLAGKGLNSLGSKGLTIYKTATDGISVVIY
jgi:nitrite reductase/ring-hydroxylating ferredoxin subunit